ncbi:TetR/AcrR family transcriptional regulator [Candidatus Nitronereus thalassa]|uniref:TetR/AcrR family transcriptional regulator n=1 Tax=Candidatus Nitronereus thalassa TaxID=3020898 RepID=A0ABU3KAU1_9BACT|nr:TetR/AcrR family transcriptional regulator [Candidatus Nitronereus thalassa]MDT7043595.1 TetR/AcrR family transcriptional regulator [Candidatus Nitronereus thalassa]
MPITKVHEDELLNRLMHVFRTYGYEGASLSVISEATGLQRASLYHRFPGGKEDMAKAVLGRAGEWLATRVLGPLSGPGTPEERIRNMGKELHAFYAGGKNCCLFDSLSFGSNDNIIQQNIRQGMSAWVDGLAKVAREAGVSPKKAKQQAQDAVSQIQGTLVVARVIKDYGPFERMLDDLPRTLLRKN